MWDGAPVGRHGHSWWSRSSVVGIREGYHPLTCPRGSGPMVTQYKEYERSAVACGYKTLKSDDPSATLVCMINACNPTGDYMSIEEVKVCAGMWAYGHMGTWVHAPSTTYLWGCIRRRARAVRIFGPARVMASADLSSPRGRTQ